MVEALDAPNKRVKEFKAIHNIDTAWNEVKKKTMNRCWGKAWKKCIHNFDGFLNDKEARRDIVTFSHQAGFEDIDGDHVINFIESNRKPLGYEDLIKTRLRESSLQ